MADMDALTWLEILKRYGFSTFVAIVLLLVILGLVPSTITHEADVDSKLSEIQSQLQQQNVYSSEYIKAVETQTRMLRAICAHTAATTEQQTECRAMDP